MSDRGRRTLWWVAAYLVDAVLHLVAQTLHEPADRLISLVHVTQWLLMPLLAGALLAARPWPRPRVVVVTLLALAFSWLGDTLPAFVPDGTGRFLTLVGCFLLAQVTYIAAFLPHRERSVLRRRTLLIPYAVVLLALVLICAPGAGGMLVPVVVYGLCLTTMAVLATGLGPLGAVGGTLFLVSDSMIAIGAFAPDSSLPHAPLLVMVTYGLAQVLLVAGVLHASPPRRHRVRPPRASPIEP